MSTSGGGGVNALAYLVVVLAVFRGVQSVTDARALILRPRPPALVLWAMVAAPSAAQFAVPGIFDALSRQPDLVRNDYQLWRLVTSAYVQDGGVFGTVSNLIILYIVAALAVPLWGPLPTGLLFVFGTALFNVPAVYFYPSDGGGNSGATFFLATSILALLVVRERSRTSVAALATVIVVGVLLIAIGDAHGTAFLGGVVVGTVVAAVAGPAVGKHLSAQE